MSGSIGALWTVEFENPSNHYEGAGIAVFETGRILGGDSFFYYVGTFSIEKNHLI